MTRILSISLAMLAFAVTASFAAPLNAKVTAVEKDTVRVVVAGKYPEWVKKGSKVRFLGTKGTIVKIAADTLSIATPKAKETKPGAEVTVDKPRAGVSGC